MVAVIMPCYIDIYYGEMARARTSYEVK
jgi:hypothetical protein